LALSLSLSRYINADGLDKEFRFFSTLVGEEGPRIPGVKESRVCFQKTLSGLLAFHSTP
jgi:hypothetical protein